MRTHFTAFLFIIASTVPAFADEIPVNRVILSTSGLANFELKTRVDGNAALQFPVRLEQVDDILKSLVVFDEKGRLGGVTLPGKQPLAETFRDLPFRKDQLASPMMLLNAYQGAVLTIKGGQFAATGKILQVEAEETQTKEGATLTRHRISLITPDGIKQAVLEDLQSIQFADEHVKQEIARALDTIRENGTSGQRVLTVNLLGAGSRDVELSYVVDAPLWKTAYRMVLPQAGVNIPEAGKEKGLLQGWAVVENATASDWKNVDLTLVSGNPVTYRQSLYQSYYVQRPEIPVQVFGRVMPRVDQGSVASAAQKEESDAAESSDNEELKDVVAKKTGMMMKPMNAPMARQGLAMQAGGMAMPAAAPPPMEGMDAVAQAANAAQSAEATTQVLFRFPDRFSLKSGQSMMLPFVSKQVPMERISLYQPDTHPTHPLAAVEIKNDGETGLPPGILTLYEESALLHGTEFVGDAQVPVMGPGEKRMISYALDSKTTISREDRRTQTEDRMAISQGLLRTSVVDRQETVYTIKAPPKESRTVVLEQPKMGDYKIVEPDPKTVEVSEDHYRIRVPVKADETKVVSVVLENQQWQSIGIDGMPAEQLAAYATSRGKLDPAAREQFRLLAVARRAIDALDQQIRLLQQQRQTIFEDQERVRENLKSLDGKSDVKDKYLAKLNAQEDKIADLDKQKEKLDVQRAAKAQELQKMIAGMKF